MSACVRLTLLTLLSLLALAAPALAAEPFLTLPEDASGSVSNLDPGLAPSQAPAFIRAPMHQDQELAREHERFTQFALEQMQRMNANILGGRNSMQVQKAGHGLYRASFKAIDIGGMVCQVRRAESDPQYFVGTVLYKEQILESEAQTAEASRRGPFEPVSEKANRIIYSSKRGGGWN